MILYRKYIDTANSIINIEILDGNFDEVMIFSSTGKLIQTIYEGVNNLSIDVSHYATGTYFVRFITGRLAITKRFIKE